MLSQELYECGMIDEVEHETMCMPVQRQIRHLEFLGPTWRAPTLQEVIGNLPFMRNQPAAVRKFVVTHGNITMLPDGGEIDVHEALARGDLWVVLSGVLKVGAPQGLGSGCARARVRARRLPAASVLLLRAPRVSSPRTVREPGGQGMVRRPWTGPRVGERPAAARPPWQGSSG